MRIVGLRLVVSLVALLTVAHGGELDVEDLVDLKTAGFTEEEIHAELEKAKPAPRFDEAGLARLRASGFSEAFLAKLGGGGPRLDDLRAMHAAGKSAVEILRALPRSGERRRLTPSQALELTRAEVPPIVVRAWRGGAVDADELLRRSKAGASVEELVALLDVVGTGGAPTAAQSAALEQADVPESLRSRLRAAGDEPDARVADGCARYTHPAGRFSVDFPTAWRWVLRPHKEKILLEYVFTPDRKEADPEKLSIGFSVVPFHLAPGTTFATAPLDDLVGLTVPSILTEEPGLRVEGAPKSGRLAGAEARFIELRGKARGDDSMRIRTAIVRKEGVLCFVSAWAPVELYDQQRGAFERCFASLTLRGPRLASTGKRMSAQDFVDRYRGSVVRVSSGHGSGTGFIVRKDGYVLTNHHVVFDARTRKFAREFTLQFDASQRRRPVRAVLLAARRGGPARTTRNLARGEIDIALLKITDSGTYLPLPITPMADVKLSDPVITMGFPHSDLLGGAERLSMFVTRGVVVRFNNDEWGETEGVFIDAKITHGNSGGPCVDLETGGVIGLNTWGFEIGKDGSVQNDLVGYNGVVPIDAALEEWPDILLPASASLDGLSPENRMALAVDYHGRGLFGAARRQAKSVAEARPDLIDARVVEAASAAEIGDMEECLRLLDAALAADPGHYRALFLRAQLHARKREFAEAMALAQRAVATRPQSAIPYLARSELALTLGRYAEALADADTAALLGRNRSSDPEILAGRALYALGKPDEGVARYRKALAIAPGSFDAAMGVAEYYRRKGAQDRALAEFTRIAGAAPLRPGPVEAIADCLVATGKLPEARQAYWNAIALHVRHRHAPPERLFAQFIGIDGRLGGSDKRATVMRARCRFHPQSVAAHADLALFYHAGGNAPALAFGHAIAARKLSRDAEKVRAAMAPVSRAALSIEDIATMEKLNYGRAGWIIVQCAPTSFRLSPELLQQLGQLSPFTLQALKIIDARQKKGDPSIGERNPGD